MTPRPMLVQGESPDAFAFAYCETYGVREGRRRRRMYRAVERCHTAARTLPVGAGPEAAIAHLRSEVCGTGILAFVWWTVFGELIKRFVAWMFFSSERYERLTGRPAPAAICGKSAACGCALPRRLRIFDPDHQDP